MFKTKLSYFLLLLTVTFFVSCNSDKIYEEHNGIDNLQWKKSDVQKYEVNVAEAGLKYDINVAVRFIEGCPYMNFPVNISYINPDGKTEVFKADLQLRDEDENYLGSVVGNIYDLTIPVKENVVFDKAGIYKFEIEQTSDQDPLVFISEVGLIIEKQKTE